MLFRSYHNSMLMQHDDFDKGLIFFITGDRYSVIGRNMALLIRNILFVKANLLALSNIEEIPEVESLTYLPCDIQIPSPLFELL